MMELGSHEHLNGLSERVIGAAIEVHSNLGPGLLEGSYEACLKHELEQQGLSVRSQVLLPITYKGLIVNNAYRIDLLIENVLVVEVKAVARADDVHLAQVLTYLKHGSFPLGLILNFHAPTLTKGLKRVVGPSFPNSVKL